MEGAVRRLRLLLLFISIFVFQGQCAVPEIGKRHPQWGFPKIPTVPKVPEIPNIPKVDPVPAPNIPKVDPAPVPDLPEIDPIPNSGSNGPSPLGAYIDNSHREPFAGTVQFITCRANAADRGGDRHVCRSNRRVGSILLPSRRYPRSCRGRRRRRRQETRRRWWPSPIRLAGGIAIRRHQHHYQLLLTCRRRRLHYDPHLHHCLRSGPANECMQCVVIAQRLLSRQRPQVRVFLLLLLRPRSMELARRGVRKSRGGVSVPTSTIDQPCFFSSTSTSAAIYTSAAVFRDASIFPATTNGTGAISTNAVTPTQHGVESREYEY